MSNNSTLGSTGFMEFRSRDYRVEEKSYALPRVRALHHPLSNVQVGMKMMERPYFDDPLRDSEADKGDSFKAVSVPNTSLEESSFDPEKEWLSFKQSILQKFPSKMISDADVKRGKGMHLEELDDQTKGEEKDSKLYTQEEYTSQLKNLKEAIISAWRSGDLVKSLKLSIKVAKLLTDTSLLQYYPPVFLLVTDIFDILGDLVWERIKGKAEYRDDGTKICDLPENFGPDDVYSDAKDTCNNWFRKIDSIHELLPRIYLELAILHCWRFLSDEHANIVQRLNMMTRGLANPLASAYCRLYMVHRVQKLVAYESGYLILVITDLSNLLIQVISERHTIRETSSRKFLITLLEPTVEWIVKCIVKGASKCDAGDISLKLGLSGKPFDFIRELPCVSIIIHHLLKELPSEILSTNSMMILELIDRSNDMTFDQELNYKLLATKLNEKMPQMNCVDAILLKIMQVLDQANSFEMYLDVMDSFMDFILQSNNRDKHLAFTLDGIIRRSLHKQFSERELSSLQSIMEKLIAHFNNLKDLYALKHFSEILDLMYGRSADMVNSRILMVGIRCDYIGDPKTIKSLFKVCQSLRNGIVHSSMEGFDYQQQAYCISRFVQMVDFGYELEQHLSFLVECRGSFSGITGLKESLVHVSNFLAFKALRNLSSGLGFVKSCIAFNEVTIPSVSSLSKKINLYLETAEVALLGGLVSHTDDIISSVIHCLERANMSTSPDRDGILSSTTKLCSFLIMVPGGSEFGLVHIIKSIQSIIGSEWWITSFKIEVLCALIHVLATLSQNKLPYGVWNAEVTGNDLLFFGVESYCQELVSLCDSVILNLVDSINRESNSVTRSNLALKVATCIMSSLKATRETSQICAIMVDVASASLQSTNKYLQYAMKRLKEYKFQCSQHAA